MFCPQCGSATAPQTKFCKSCGSALFELAQTAKLPTPEVAQNQLRTMKGAKILVFTPLLWLFSLFVTLIAASERGPEQEIAAIIAFFSTMLSLGMSGWAVFNLWRGDFFKTYREQRIRAEAALLSERKEPVRVPTPREIPREIAPVPVTATQPAPLFGATVTEHTTRSLPTHPHNPEKI